MRNNFKTRLIARFSFLLRSKLYTDKSTGNNAMTIKPIIIILGLVGFFNIPLIAAELTQDLKIVGQAKLKVLFWDVYHSTFYSQNGQYRKEQFPQELRIEYLRDIKAEDLIEKTAEEWQDLEVEKSNADRWIVLLKDIFPDISEGDSLIIHIDKNKQSEFFYNGKTIGKITEIEFGPQFLRIWLDEKCSYPKVCQKLRGEG